MGSEPEEELNGSHPNATPKTAGHNDRGSSRHWERSAVLLEQKNAIDRDTHAGQYFVEKQPEPRPR
jgi:hypothetical protein